MGAGSSSQSLVDDPFLGIFISKKSLNDMPDEKIIDTVASYQWLSAFTRSREKFIEDRIAVHLKSFILNENETYNFSRFLKTFNHACSTNSPPPSTSGDADKAVAAKRDKFVVNAVQIIRYSAKVLIENLTEEEFVLRCSRYRSNHQILPTDRGGLEPYAERRADIELLANLTRLIVDKQHENVADNYPLLFEAVSTLIVFFSATLFKATPAESSDILFSYIEHERVKQMYAAIIKVLCTFYIDATPVPPRFTNDGGSLLFGLASGLWGLLASSDSDNAASMPPLANRAQLLLLILVSSYPTEMNLFSRALFGLGNVDDPLYSSGHIISYSKLWSKIGTSLGDAGDERSLLMLYFMLLGNTNFKSFIISRQNMPTLVLPLLRVLYNAATLKTHQVYLASIALLILSQDDMYNKLLSEVELLKTPLGREAAVWYAERNIPAMTLGSFVYLNLIRAISVNLSQTRDRYLHSNCLAALANMSADTRRAHSLPMQRMVSLFEQLAKRYRRLSTEINDRFQQTSPTAGVDGEQQQTNGKTTHQANEHGSLNGNESPNDNNNMHEAEQMADLGVLEELLRMILEVINGILQHQLNDNPHLIHTILYKREVFHQFRTHPSFSDVVQNLENIIQYFLAQVEKNSNNISGADDVVRIIVSTSKAFPADQQLKKFPKLHFKFVEEQNSCEFFAPYCWKLVTLNVMHWPQHKILLFNALDEPLSGSADGTGGAAGEAGSSEDDADDDDGSEREIEIVQETKRQLNDNPPTNAATVRK